MNKNPILSICIPTFNRLNYLKEALESLMPQARSLGVEVCISDNHSEDGTAQYLESLSISEVNGFRYQIQSENIGIDSNMMAVIGMGRGRYIYPIGDDDLLPEGSLKIILKELERNCDVLLLNGWHTDSCLNPRRLNLTSELAGKTFKEPNSAFISLWSKMSFGSFLAKKSFFSENRYKKYLGTSHAYTGVIWESIANQSGTQRQICNIRCMEHPVVLLRGAEKSWSKCAARIILIEVPTWFKLLAENEIYRKSISVIGSQYVREKTSIVALSRFRLIDQLEVDDVEILGKFYDEKIKKRMCLISRTPKGLLFLFVWINKLFAGFDKKSVKLKFNK